MTQIFEMGIIKELSDIIYNDIGIKFDFLFSPSLDVIKEYRRNTLEKISLSAITPFEKDITKHNKMINFCAWKRSPINISENNKFRSFDDLIIETEKGYRARKVFEANTQFDLVFFSNENKILYDFEIFYITELFLKKIINIDLKYSIDGEILEIPYRITFNEISEFEFIDVESFGSLMTIGISFTVDGILFSPAFIEEENKIKYVDICLYNYNKNEEIDFEERNDNRKIGECDYDVENNNIIIKNDSCNYHSEEDMIIV